MGKGRKKDRGRETEGVCVRESQSVKNFGHRIYLILFDESINNNHNLGDH